MCTLIALILDRSSTKQKTFDPVWNECFIHDLQNANVIGLTVFHDKAIPPDDFVANCTIPFEELCHREKDQLDFWVSFYLFFGFLSYWSLSIIILFVCEIIKYWVKLILSEQHIVTAELIL